MYRGTHVLNDVLELCILIILACLWNGKLLINVNCILHSLWEAESLSYSIRYAVTGLRMNCFIMPYRTRLVGF
jgi:hypothetical protein